MIKETTKTVYTTTDGTEFIDKNEAMEYEKTYLEIKGLMRSLMRVGEICSDCADCVKCPFKRFFPNHTDKETDDCPFGNEGKPWCDWSYIEI